uniref:Type II secretion system protein H n=1 Tax=Desulfatirhabdium butyrativorans TaxID=340467 RepID=A0A7C4MMX6_9BACT
MESTAGWNILFEEVLMTKPERPFRWLFLKRCGHSSGLTLTELMVVIAIIGVMVLAAVPSLSAFVSRTRTKGAAQDLYFTLQQVRMNAIRSSGRWALEFSTTSCRVIDCVDNDCTTTTDNQVVRTIDLTQYKGTSVSQNFSANRIVFNAEGTSNAGSITVQNPKDRFTITVASSGRIRMQ